MKPFAALSRLVSTLAFGSLLAACSPVPAPLPESEPAPAAPQPETTGATVAFTLTERDLLPENLAYDPVDEAFYVGSTRKGKILRISRSGEVSDFVAPRKNGLWMVMGMKIDTERRHLWVASSDGDNLEGYQRSRGRAAGLFKFDLTTGSLLGRWTLETPGATHFFNDLVVTVAGDVYVTNMLKRASIFVLHAGSGEIERFARPGGSFRAPNGIATAPDGTLFVAHREGISAFDADLGERTLLTLPAGVTVSAIDGLYFHQDSLIGIHPAEKRIHRYRLDASQRVVTAVEQLDIEHPLLTDLTTGVLVGDELFFLASAQLTRINKGVLPPPDQLVDVVVLKIRL